jgi:hypothetical protein
MFVALQPVRPGDLITALAMNRFIDCLKDLDRRLLVLEQAKAAAETKLAITSGQVVSRLERTAVLKLTGSGLAPAGLTAFTINGNPFSPLSAEGDDDSLIVVMDAGHNAASLPLIAAMGSVMGFTFGLRNSRNETASIGINRPTHQVADIVNLGNLAGAWTESSVGLGSVTVGAASAASNVAGGSFNNAQ